MYPYPKNQMPSPAPIPENMSRPTERPMPPRPVICGGSIEEWAEYMEQFGMYEYNSVFVWPQ